MSFCVVLVYFFELLFVVLCCQYMSRDVLCYDVLCCDVLRLLCRVLCYVMLS
jgi:hypothetical protein